MRSLIVILLLALVACVAAQSIATDSFVISNLGPDETLGADNNENFGPATFATGSALVSISAPYPVVVCFQEGYAILSADLEATCNAEGIINAPTDSLPVDENKYSQDGTGGAKKRLLRRAMDDNTYSYNTTLYLRDQMVYGISASWADQTANQTGTVTINVAYEVCPAGNNNYGPNCSIPAVTVANTGLTNITVSPTGPGTLLTFTINDKTFLNSFVVNAHYTAQTPAEETHLRKRDISGSPVQLYARRAGFPIVTNDTNTSVFDPSTSNTTSATTSSTSLTFNGPEQGMWFILLSTSGNVTYDVSVSLQTYSCPAGLYPSLTNTSECVAANDIIGPNGDYTNTSVPANGTLFTFPASAAGITYFNYTTDWLLVGVVGGSHGSDGAPGLYASATSIPSADSNAVASAQSAQVNFLNVRTLNEATANWIIAVQPLEDSDSNGFQIFAGAGCANNCSSQGSCPSVEGADGYCTCNSGYKDFFCSTQKLKTIYIVLIAIGGAIVLAIAIGVPVGCYLKNRKRARYERV